MRVKLSDIFDLQMGKTPSRNELSYWGGNHKWVSIADISGAEKYIRATKECITDRGVQESGIKAVPKGTVIMSFKLSIGRAAITAEDMFTNEAIMAFIDKHVLDIDASYLYYLFSGTDWSAGTNRAVLGLTLNKAVLSQKEIEIPPLDAQLSAVRTLDKISGLLALRKWQLVKLDELVKARFVELFGGKNYPVYRLSDVCTKITDGTHKTPEYQSTGITFISAKNIVNGKLDFADVKFITEAEFQNIQKRCQTEYGDILISKSGSLGMIAMIETEEKLGLFESLAVLKYQRDKLNGTFLKEQLRSDTIQRKLMKGVKGITVKHLHLNVISEIPVIVPPLDLQERFAAFVEQSDKSKLAIQNSVDKLETLKAACMQAYFG